jgi:hypothetical protein
MYSFSIKQKQVCKVEEGGGIKSEIVKLSQISQTPVMFMYLNSLTVLWPAYLLNVMTSGAKHEHAGTDRKANISLLGTEA